MHIDIQKLHDKYLSLSIPNPFSLEQIHTRLTEEYYAEKVDLEHFSSLRNDPEANFDQAVAAYTIRDPRGTFKLIKLNKVEDIHEPLEFSWVIDSTVIGMSFLFNLELNIFDGIEKSEMYLGNLRYEEYLIALYLAGYIKFENDPLIDEITARYRAGNYLRYFGMQDGYENYLYK
ncbi:pyruvate kinase [Paenibacillus amylolyticus]|uniref:pyruvate kinase n=1 Tax=Paenibacillus amylolyticus TaxID=1451 RepID=UPI003EBE01ED